MGQKYSHISAHWQVSTYLFSTYCFFQSCFFQVADHLIKTASHCSWLVLDMYLYPFLLACKMNSQVHSLKFFLLERFSSPLSFRATPVVLQLSTWDSARIVCGIICEQRPNCFSSFGCHGQLHLREKRRERERRQCGRCKSHGNLSHFSCNLLVTSNLWRKTYLSLPLDWILP